MNTTPKTLRRRSRPRSSCSDKWTRNSLKTTPPRLWQTKISGRCCSCVWRRSSSSLVVKSTAKSFILERELPKRTAESYPKVITRTLGIRAGKESLSQRWPSLSVHVLKACPPRPWMATMLRACQKVWVDRRHSRLDSLGIKIKMVVYILWPRVHAEQAMSLGLVLGAIRFVHDVLVRDIVRCARASDDHFSTTRSKFCNENGWDVKGKKDGT